VLFAKKPFQSHRLLLKKREKMIFFDFNEKALQKGSDFDCKKCRKKVPKNYMLFLGDFFDAIASMCLKLRVLGFLTF
jgi:hypothetical protein